MVDALACLGNPSSIHAEGRAARALVDAARREVVETAPSGKSLADAVGFAESRSAWIAARLNRLPLGSVFRPGMLIELAGEPCRLERAAMRIIPRLVAATANEPARLIAHGEGEAFARTVERGLRAVALRALSEHTAVHCARLELTAPKPTLTDARGRWGSCRQAMTGRPAAIRYSWRLILAPPFVLDYVAAHECAHLVEANHSPRFWALTRKLYGDPTRARAWLKTHGASLHAVGRG